jgi:fibronectin-binding autotransporter adhesin
VKRLFFAVTICFATLAAACGGGSSTPTPTPTPVGFSNASLNGQYAFEMSGTDGNGNFIARVGTFTANGSGSISAAIEDVNDGGSANFVQFTGGTYTIGSDGRGTLSLTGGGTLSNGLGLNIALSSTKSGLAVQTDGFATSSGSFDLQTASAFSLPSITGQYTFDLAGLDLGTGAPLSLVGEFAMNGGGGLTGGFVDTNDGSAAAPVGPTPLTPSSFQMDATFGSSSGRGSASVNGQTLAFYIVDGTRLKFLEEDGIGQTVGDAFQQSGTIPTQMSGLSGNFAFIISASAVAGNFGNLARVGSAAFNGSGALASVSLDDNNAGTYKKLTGDTGAYTIDAAGSGRGTFTFTDSSLGTFSYVFYLFSPTQAVVLETSNAVVGAGSMSAQPSSISTASLAGNYAFAWSGVTIPSSGNIGFEEDFVGEYALSSSGAISGTADFTELGSTSKSSPIFTGVPLTGMFNAGGTGRNTYQAMVSPGNGSPSTTINFAAYVANGNTVYVVSTDSTRVTAGTVTTQTAP